MKINKIRFDLVDKYGFAWTHKITNREFGQTKAVIEEIGGIGREPIYKRIMLQFANIKKFFEFDRDLFGKFHRRTK